jgi:hypothetical protein
MKAFYPIAAIALSFAVMGCALGGLLPRRQPSYFPMSSNRVWEYDFRQLVKGKVWPVVVRSRSPRFVPELGRVAAIFDEEYPDQTLPVAFFFSEGFLQSDIGLRYRLERGVERAPIGIQPMRLMPEPPRIGSRWAYSEPVFRAFGAATALEIRWTGSITREASVMVPAGEFRDCLRVESIATHRLPLGEDAHEYRYVDWYAPNVGLVKNEYSSGQSVYTRMELVRYADAEAPEGQPGELRMALR